MLQNEFNTDDSDKLPWVLNRIWLKIIITSTSENKTKQNTSFVVYTLLEKLVKFSKTCIEL